jgi:Ricin-type beta-trefoil lectin domain.
MLIPVASHIVGAAAPPSTVGGGVFQIHALSDQGFCMNLDDQRVQPTLVVSQCTVAESQKFTLTHGADGLNLIVDRKGNCLSRGIQIGKGFFAVADAPCTYQLREQWSFSLLGLMMRGSSGLCLEIPRAADGAEVHLVPCTDVPLQHWKLSA